MIKARALLIVGYLLLSSTPALALQGAVFFDGLNYAVQWGSTPDAVQDQLNGSLAPDVTYATTQHMSVWLRIYRGGLLSMGLDPKAWMTIYQSSFYSTYSKGVLVILANDPDANNNISVTAIACSDSQCTDFIWGNADNVFPADGGWHNLQTFIDMIGDKIQLQVDSEDDYPNAFTTYSSGNPFNTPIAGMYWTVGCDSDFWSINPDNLWETCLTGSMAELWVYSGPQYEGSIDTAAGQFWHNSGSLIRATSHDNTSGTDIFGDYPTIYLRGGTATFTDGNAYDFSGLPNPPVLPWVTYTTTDPDGLWGAGLIDDSNTPY
jgi:hypothetical protein